MQSGCMNIVEMTFPSPLGEWRHAEAKPPADLRGMVATFWESSGNVAFSHEKLVPSGQATLIFNLGGPQVMYIDGDLSERRRYSRAWLSGLFDRPLFVGPAYDASRLGTHLVGVTIEPSAIYSLFGLQAFEVRNQVFEADELFGPRINHLWQRIVEAPTTAARFAVLASFLRDCQQTLARPAPFSAVLAMRHILSSAGTVRIGDLCNELDISRKHLSVLFNRTIGLSPKAFGRLTRFRAAMCRLEAATPGDFAGMAIDLGYSDQAHFINDFSAFTGESPTRFLANRSADGETVLYAQTEESRPGA